MKSIKKQSITKTALQIGLPEDVIIRFIYYKWIMPFDREKRILDEEDIARVRLIWELQQEFGVNDEAVPIILHLIDQLNRIHLELNKGTYEHKFKYD